MGRMGSKTGVQVMDDIARAQPGIVKALADFGMTISYGLPASLHFFKGEWRKLAVHALLVGIFFVWLQSLPATNSLLNSYTIVIGLLTGLLGIGVISLAASTVSIILVKTAPSAVAPVVPGITLPLWEGLIALAIVVAVHEVAHGVLARVVNLKIHSSGILLFGFLPIGAFVEPDEHAFARLELVKKRRILIAGTTSNFVFFLLFFAVLAGISLWAPAMIDGVTVASIESNSTLAGVLSAGTLITTIDGQKAGEGAVLNAIMKGNQVNFTTSDGSAHTARFSQLVISIVPDDSPSRGILAPGDIIDEIDCVPVRTTAELLGQLETKSPGQVVTFTLMGTAGEKLVKLNENGKMGITATQRPAFAFENKPKPAFAAVYGPIVFLLTILGLTAFLSLALAIVNILPIFTTDGYRIAYEELLAVLGRKRERLARDATLAASVFLLLLLLINLARWFKFF